MPVSDGLVCESRSPADEPKRRVSVRRGDRRSARRPRRDLSLAWLPFEKQALERAVERDFGGARIPVATAQDLVVYKAVAFRDRDRDDILRLLAAHRDEIDLAYVRARVVEFAEALDEPERVERFDRLIARSAGC